MSSLMKETLEGNLTLKRFVSMEPKRAPIARWSFTSGVFSSLAIINSGAQASPYCMQQRMSVPDDGQGFTDWWQPPRQIYIKCSSDLVPCAEAMGYTMGKTLGSGTYAKVKAAWSPYEGRMIAIKNLNKKQASDDYLTKFLPREIAILQQVSHPNIITILQIIETEVRCFFMLEIAENGDLLDYINTRRYLPEPEARFVFTQMSQAIGFCHERDIVHRDLKCENVMLNRGMDVKIGDFGFALDLKNKSASTPCGSYSYAAPELFTSNGQNYNGKKADIWSMGVILYAMVCGRLPFGDDSQVKKMQSQNRQINFSRNLTFECRGFIHCVLNMDIEARPNIQQILVADWTVTEPSTRPIQLTPSNPTYKYKYTVENCLPSFLHHTKSRTSCSSSSLWAQTITAPYPSTYGYAHMMRQQYFKQQKETEKSMVNPSAHSSTESAVDSGDVQSLDDGSSVSLRGQGSHHKKLVSKIGAAGRKIADAVKSVKTPKGRERSDSRASQGSQVRSSNMQ